MEGLQGSSVKGRAARTKGAATALPHGCIHAFASQFVFEKSPRKGAVDGKDLFRPMTQSIGTKWPADIMLDHRSRQILPVCETDV